MPRLLFLYHFYGIAHAAVRLERYPETSGSFPFCRWKNLHGQEFKRLSGVGGFYRELLAGFWDSSYTEHNISLSDEYGKHAAFGALWRNHQQYLNQSVSVQSFLPLQIGCVHCQGGETDSHTVQRPIKLIVE